MSIGDVRSVLAQGILDIDPRDLVTAYQSICDLSPGERSYCVLEGMRLGFVDLSFGYRSHGMLFKTPLHEGAILKPFVIFSSIVNDDIVDVFHEWDVMPVMKIDHRIRGMSHWNMRREHLEEYFEYFKIDPRVLIWPGLV